MMVGNNLKVCVGIAIWSTDPESCQLYPSQDQQLQQIVDKTIMEADQDGDGKLSFEEFAMMVSNTVTEALSTARLAYAALLRI